MNQKPIPKPIALALILTLLTSLFGFILGGIFGGLESELKNNLNQRAAEVSDTVYKNDEAKKTSVVEKSWIYLKRSHLHAGAIGAVGAASILSVIVIGSTSFLAKISALSLGLGGLVYSVFWLIAGFIAPGLGSTSLAKEKLFFMATPSAALCIFGLTGVIICVARVCFKKPT